MRVLVTGGAGFVGSSVALGLKDRHPAWEVVAFDNLRRRGSELNLPRLREHDVSFVHGDVRQAADLDEVGPVEAVVECSAEPSVLAGLDGGLDYLLQTNLNGAVRCLDVCRRDGAALIFLSTSRVYPVQALAGLAIEETEARFELADAQPLPGASARGIAEEFPLAGARTLYGATKLAAELLIAEYRESFGVRAVVDRCGVIAGPWQMGRLDQGVFSYWLLAHVLGRPLRYLGFGGSGKQVRDLLHVDDLVDLVERQLADPGGWDGLTVNVGGGRDCSLSLLELTGLCRELTGRTVDVTAAGEDRPGDVPVYLSDCARAFGLSDWRPRRGPRDILADIFDWAAANERTLRVALAEG